ncbi:zinc-dependent alcohol dehydrogenase [Meridianimarinicoccus aquatilis]|uniref:Zinc-binding alcohol dehydrogenase n=1 Tax=Meridianimarinicoccus aquatilis TaxID=2552766 RepID=A0A4R6AT60_9RHOB|nr:zinc-binding alcohol dehydrogenase [Fluviibacterium aquatile]TDL87751.1 zinc-binding alcohol dehydrogenase [Fluviibacterium aquatile]
MGLKYDGGDRAMTAQALWTVAQNTFALRPVALSDGEPGNVTLKALYSGVSRGTEGLVARGGVPESEWHRMRCPFQEGDFPFPVKYGYAFVGEIIDGPSERLGQRCFALHPHQSHAVLPGAAAVPLPNALPARRAVLAANMETAANIVWDSGAGPGDRVLIVGAGVVGLLTAHIIAGMPGADVTIVDVNPARKSLADTLGVQFSLPDAAPRDMDITINTSASAAGLRLALEAAGRSARVVEASWHGSNDVALPLGGAFHSKRLSIVSSQVGDIPADRKARWDYTRRLSMALRLLAQAPQLEALLTHEIPFADAPARLPILLAPGAEALCPVLTYP